MRSSSRTAIASAAMSVSEYGCCLFQSGIQLDAPVPRWSYLMTRYPAPDRARRNAGGQYSELAPSAILSRTTPFSAPTAGRDSYQIRTPPDCAYPDSPMTTPVTELARIRAIVASAPSGTRGPRDTTNATSPASPNAVEASTTHFLIGSAYGHDKSASLESGAGCSAFAPVNGPIGVWWPKVLRGLTW